jgi:signal transduction histidine kinase
MLIGEREGMASPLVAAKRQPESAGLQAAIEDDVRRMVARELHDRVAQTLTGMLVDVENFKTQQVGWDDVLRQMDMVQTSTRQVLSSLRQLLHDLRGEDQFTDGFVDALGALIVRFEEKTSISAELDVKPGWPKSLTPPANLNLYRIVEEALTNVGMHSGAHTVRVVLELPSENELGLEVDDDGRGIDTDASRPMGMGTVGMKERALFLGGQLRIESQAGGGTRVRAVFPKELLIPHESTSLVKVAGRITA